jgi:tetratricopeptide (TPR) repeat protein
LKARQEVEAALRSNPYQPEYLYVLGLVLEKQGDRAGALDALRRTVLVDPREADAYYEMAKIYAQAGEHARALEAIRNALRIVPDDPEYRQALESLSR